RRGGRRRGGGYDRGGGCCHGGGAAAAWREGTGRHGSRDGFVPRSGGGALAAVAHRTSHGRDFLHRQPLPGGARPAGGGDLASAALALPLHRAAFTRTAAGCPLPAARILPSAWIPPPPSHFHDLLAQLGPAVASLFSSADGARSSLFPSPPRAAPTRVRCGLRRRICDDASGMEGRGEETAAGGGKFGSKSAASRAPCSPVRGDRVTDA
ncbi:unnamed protein product, partial [Urochloa humidicola]